MPKIHILIGLPGSGKSTWRAAYLAANPEADPVILSTDDMVDVWAAEKGLTYSEAFNKAPMKDFTTRMKYQMIEAVKAGRDIILDRTNMAAKNRAEFIEKLTEDYEVHAVAFVVTDAELKRRLAERAEKTGKSIPEFVIKSMAARYVAPDKAEGFDHITYVKPV